MSLTRPEIDTHPKTLAANALKTRTYDVVIIGGGPAGTRTAARVAQGGLKALLVESELVGGECLYWACVPSKALLRASEVIESTEAVGGARQRLELLVQKYGASARPKVDLKGTWARRDMFTNGWKDDGQVDGMHRLGVDIAHGFGRVSGVKRVEIKDWHSGEQVEVEAKHAIVIATGSAPLIPEIEGLKESGFWIPRDAVSASEVPEHLIVLGGGAVGAEMATLYSQLGSKVTLISSSRTILPKMVPEAGRMVQESLERAGVHVKLQATVTKVSRTSGSLAVTLSDGSVVDGTQLLIAAGRRSQTAGVIWDGIGTTLTPREGSPIVVNDSMCVKSVPDGWLYAVGDVNGRAMLTHISQYQAKLAGAAIVARARGTYESEVAARVWDKLTAKPTGLAIAQCVFTDPQVAASGLTLEQARARGIKARVVAAQMSGPGVWLHADGYQGWAQWVIDDANVLIGATFVGRDAANLLQASTMAIVGRMTLDQIWHVTPPFPSMSEIYTTLSEAAADN